MHECDLYVNTLLKTGLGCKVGCVMRTENTSANITLQKHESVHFVIFNGGHKMAVKDSISFQLNGSLLVNFYVLKQF